METLIKEYAEKIKLYFDSRRLCLFIRVKFKDRERTYGLPDGLNPFEGFEVIQEDFYIAKERFVRAWLNSYGLYKWVYGLKNKGIDLCGKVFRDDKETEYNEDTWEFEEQTDEEYLSYFYSEDYGTKAEFMSLPTWSEYKQSEEFLSIYGKQFLNETLIFE